MPKPTLKRGSSEKEAVIEMQTLLNTRGGKVGVDGDFGGGSEKALNTIKASLGLPEDGTCDQATWDALPRSLYSQDSKWRAMPLEPSTKVSGSKSSVVDGWNDYGNLLEALSNEMGFTPAAAVAVLAVESGGQGFWDGRMVIRFENHIFNRWGKNHTKVFADHFKMNSSEQWKDHFWRADPNDPWRPLHTKEAGQPEEYAVLAFARLLDDTAALNSISMGAPQIMGFNSEKIGFATVQDMFESFSKDIYGHILGLFDFIESDYRMVQALRKGDWRGFAYVYNGSGQADYYGGKIGENVDYAKSIGIS